MPSRLLMETKQKPRGRPLSRSMIMATSLTSPNWLNSSRISASDASKERFPTYIFVLLILFIVLPDCLFSLNRPPTVGVNQHQIR